MLKGIISKILDDQVTIKFADGQEFRVFGVEIGGNCVVGQEVALSLAVIGSGQIAEDKLAKSILNEMIGDNQ